jgi:RIMS-binding protein 2
MAARNRNPQQNMQQPMRNPRMQQQQQMGMQNQGQMNPGQPQQVIEHDENLSDKEIYPGSLHQQQMVTMTQTLTFYFS